MWPQAPGLFLKQRVIGVVQLEFERRLRRLLNSFVTKKYTHWPSCWRSQTAVITPTSAAFSKTLLQVMARVQYT